MYLLRNCYLCFFFFSSRRRHTRSYGDWSSDVCSSDLISPARKESTRSKAGAKRSRDALIADLIGEMTSWSARDRMNAFRSWLKGSLSLIHLHVLSTLEADGPLPMSRLADMLDVSVASATGIVSRMEERNIVERRHTDDDR